MHRPKVEPKNIESVFLPDEMFFSTTDLKGIILSGNDVFIRVSKFSKEELIGKPHNIIRHPDMPRIVFKLLWDYIQSGKPIVAYVKNIAKDGSYYWVLATVVPIFDNEGNIEKYLSIRIKPTTQFFDHIPKVYAELLNAEKSGGMEASLKKLEEIVRSLGYKSYDSFMTDILSKEIEDKKDVLKVEDIPPDMIFENSFTENVATIFRYAKKIDELYDSIYRKITHFENLGKLLDEKSDRIFSLTDDIRLISLNSSVESFKLGSQGASFSVLSAEMRKNSEVGNKIIDEMRKITEIIMEDIDRIILLINISKLEVIAITKFLHSILEEDETREDNDIEELEQNIIDLVRSLKISSEKTYSYSEKMGHHLLNISEYLKKLKILIKRLEFLYLNGMVESAHQTETSFSIIFTEVNKLVESTKDILNDISVPLSEVKDENRNLKYELEEVEYNINKITDTISNISNV
ncbi:MAG TPA: PAS domain S-box protein [Persephonella sp.]|uniref:Potential sensory protein n=1 Tax=Persephonella marina (strain DSM 14350 / EX-H1) TaxID=123214 RepID=C0QPE6_PERMH|nr:MULTISPECIES: PAS domain-containing methyl-accepting chemotaxis protein [Persephonella]ACO03088.1 potential sensory protein [Persephonella marina EX-H1]HCB69843.1 PAS domain S-box protein [Persephonella sp.]